MPRDDRVDAVLEHLLAERSAGRSGCYLSSEAVERLLAAADGRDPLRHPVPELKGRAHLILYFETSADANEFAGAVRAAFSRPVDIRL